MTEPTAHLPREGSPGDPLQALLEECFLRWEAEGGTALDDLCRQHPEHAQALREGVGLLRDSGIGPADPALPERLGEYRIVGRLGGGGMGAVFVAEQESLQRRVALKVVRPELLFFGGSRERFRREAEAVARLHHPSIVPVFAWGEANGLPFFAMELVEGCSLAAVLAAFAGRPSTAPTGDDLAAVVAARAGQPVVVPWPLAGPWPRVVGAIVVQLADALQHAHERGVLHRDVKPSNVVVGIDGRVRLLDFGLARTDGDEAITRSGTPIGSLAYMSPEQLLGRRDVDARSDVYSLGVTLHELLALQRPFRGADAESLRAAILGGARKPLPPDDGTTLWADFETVCRKAMDVDPGQRYATVAAMGADVAAALDGRPITARRLGPAARILRAARRRPARAALFVALAVGVPLVLLLGGLLLEGRSARDLGRTHAERIVAAQKVASAFFDYRSAKRGEAQRGFDAVLAADPGHELAVVGRLLCALSADDAEDLDAVLARCHDVTAAHPMLRWFAAEAARLRGRQAEADALLQALPVEPPPHAIDWFVLGVRESLLGQRGDAAHFRRALHAIEQAILLDRSEVRSPIFHVYAAETAVLCDDHETGQRAVRAIESLWGDSAMALASAGRATMVADGARSVALLTRARDLEPANAMLHLFLAESLLYQERHDDAAASYAAALARDDRLASAWGGLALLHLGQGRLDSAVACSQRYVECAPDLGLAWKVRAQALHLSRRWADACDAWRQAVLRMPDDRVVHEMFLGALAQLGDTAGADAERARFAARR